MRGSSAFKPSVRVGLSFAASAAGFAKSVRLRRVAGQKKRRAIVLNDNGEMIRGMTRRSDRDNIPCVGQSLARNERAKRLRH
jgi:hypothetical protein